jgi:hypothetical protein
MVPIVWKCPTKPCFRGVFHMTGGRDYHFWWSYKDLTSRPKPGNDGFFFVGKSSPRYAQQFSLVKYYHLPRYCNLEKKSSEEPANLGYLGGTRLWTHDHMWNVANEWYMMIYGHVEWCAPHECVCITILYVAGSCSILYVHIYIHAFFGKELAVVSQLLSGFLSSIYFMYSFS